MSELELENYAPSCERNKDVILNQLKSLLRDCENVLEVGSFSGQHALHFSQHLPHLYWHTSDLAVNLSALNANLSRYAPDNCRLPIELDVANGKHWPEQLFDAIFTANTLHIMSWLHATKFLEYVKHVAAPGALLIVYGPFKYQGAYTSASNADFDIWLKDRDINSGIRDFEAVNQLLNLSGFKLIEDIAMPANNQLLVFQQG